MGSGLKRQCEEVDDVSPSSRTNGTAPSKKPRTRPSSQNAMNTSNSRSRATPTGPTIAIPPEAATLASTTALSHPSRSHDNKNGILKYGPTKPSAVLGLPTVIARLPLDTCRDALLQLPASDIRALLSQYATARPRSRTVAKLTNAYDVNYGPRPDQLVSFDGLVSAIKLSLEPFKNNVTDTATATASISPLKQTLNAPNGVFVNIRVLHSMALSPASLATKLRALQALVEIGDYLITRQLLFHPEQRALFVQEPLGPAFLGICASLSGPERCFVLPEIKEELEGQVVVFNNHGLFRGVVEGFELLMTAGNVVPEVQAMPVHLDPEEEDLDDGEAEIGDSQDY